MPLDQQAKDKIDAWVGGKGSNLQCNGCGHKGNWDIEDTLLGLTHVPYPFAQKVNIVGSGASLFVGLVCPKCGVTALINIQSIGLA